MIALFPKGRRFVLGLLTGVALVVIGCTALDQLHYLPKLKPSAEIKVERLDRIELYTAGLHVGTIIFDKWGNAVFVGDGSEIQAVLSELMAYLGMIQQYSQPPPSEEEYDGYEGPLCPDPYGGADEPCPSAAYSDSLSLT